MPTCGACGDTFRFTAAQEATDPRPPYRCDACSQKAMVEADFADLERRYLAGLEKNDPATYKQLVALIPPRAKVSRDDAREVVRVLDSFSNHWASCIVKRMANELGMGDI